MPRSCAAVRTMHKVQFVKFSWSRWQPAGPCNFRPTTSRLGRRGRRCSGLPAHRAPSDRRDPSRPPARRRSAAGDARSGARAGREPQHGGDRLRRARRRRLDHHDAGLGHVRERAPARSVAAPIRRRVGAAPGRPRGAGLRPAARARAARSAARARADFVFAGSSVIESAAPELRERRHLSVGRRARSDAGADRGAGARVSARAAQPGRRHAGLHRRRMVSRACAPRSRACCRRRAGSRPAPTTC